MNSSTTSQLRCTVAGEEKLPPDVGGKGAICSAIARASGPALQAAGIAPQSVAVSVAVRSPYRISAVPSVGGNSLPEQNVGISDHPLNERAIQMLADAVAAEFSKLGQE